MCCILKNERYRRFTALQVFTKNSEIYFFRRVIKYEYTILMYVKIMCFESGVNNIHIQIMFYYLINSYL